MSAPIILAARRADDLTAPRYAGEVPGTCDGCHAAVMIGPRILALCQGIPHHQLLCHACVIRLAPQGRLAHLGNAAVPPEVN